MTLLSAEAIEPPPVPYALHPQTVLTSQWDDAISRDGQLLVLVGSDVTLLSPLAAFAVAKARGGVTVEALGELLREEFGVPEDRPLADALGEVVATLIARGVVRAEG